MNHLIKLFCLSCVAGFLLMPALGYAQTTVNAGSTTTIGYFYSASGQMIDAEDNTGVMSSYLTRGERYNGTSETFAVSNIKDITADLDSNGNVLNKYTYTAYGTQTSYTSNSQINESTTPQLSLSVNPFTYDDYYTDSESANYYLNARYYDPTLGIFLTSDSYNLPNRYMYVNGNPVMATDPTGHQFEELLRKHIENYMSYNANWSTNADCAKGYEKEKFRSSMHQKEGMLDAVRYLQNQAVEGNINSIKIKRMGFNFLWTGTKPISDAFTLGKTSKIGHDYLELKVNHKNLSKPLSWQLHYTSDDGGNLSLFMTQSKKDPLLSDNVKRQLHNNHKTVVKFRDPKLVMNEINKTLIYLPEVPKYALFSNIKDTVLANNKTANCQSFLHLLLYENIQKGAVILNPG